MKSVKVAGKKAKASAKTFSAAKGKKITIQVKKTNTVNPLKVKVSNKKAVKATVKKSTITLRVRKSVKKKVKVTIRCGQKKIVKYVKTK